MIAQLKVTLVLSMMMICLVQEVLLQREQRLTRYRLSKPKRDTTTATNINLDLIDDSFLSPPIPLEPGQYGEPVIFEPLPRIRISRSTYKVHSYIDFQQYIDSFEALGQYILDFKEDLGRYQAEQRDRHLCENENFACKAREQIKLVRSEVNRAYGLFKTVYNRFLLAVDQLDSTETEDSYYPEVENRPTQKPNSNTMYSDQTDEDNEFIKQMIEITNQMLNKTEAKPRVKRFGLDSLVLGWGVYSNAKNIKTLKKNVKQLYEQNVLQQEQIVELYHWLGLTHRHVQNNRHFLNELYVKVMEINNTLTELSKMVAHHSVLSINILVIQRTMNQVIFGIISLEKNVEYVKEFMRVLSTNKVNPLILPPMKLRKVLKQAKENIRGNPRLLLPEDPDTKIWSYYSIMKVRPLVIDKLLMVILTIPLIDRTLQMDVYKVHNLPALHPDYKMQMKYHLEGEYFAIKKDGLYITLPDDRDMKICKATSGYICMLNQALYPASSSKWCIYAHFTKNHTAIEEYCMVSTQSRIANEAVSLGGYLWAISTFKQEKLRVNCLIDETLTIIKPPLTIVKIGNGCEGYNDNIFIPAKSELTSEESLWARDQYFIEFNQCYQNLTRYGIWAIITFESLTEEEKANLPERLAELPPMNLKHVKKRIKPLYTKYTWQIPTNVLLFLLIASFVVVLGVVAFIVYKLYMVKKGVRGFKPMVKFFKDNVFDSEPKTVIQTPARQAARLRAIDAPTTRVSIEAPPTPPPRQPDITPEPIPSTSRSGVVISTDALQRAMDGLSKEGVHVKKYKGYLTKKQSPK